MNVLVHQGALGDVVLTFPLMRSLARRGGLLVASHRAKSRLSARLITGVEPADGESAAWSALHAAQTPSSAVDARLARASLVVSFVSDGRDAWADNARRSAPEAKIAFVAPRPPGDYDKHVTDWHAMQLAEQGVDLTTVQPAPGESNETKTGPMLIHPGSGGREKCWPIERFEAVIESLRAGGREVRVALGEAEMERWPRDTVARWRSRFGAEALTSLDALADAIAGCSLFLGNDSGPSHLAGFMGARTVALFGPTNPRVWSPRGRDVRVLSPPEPAPMDWLAPDQVLAALRA